MGVVESAGELRISMAPKGGRLEGSAECVRCKRAVNASALLRAGEGELQSNAELHRALVYALRNEGCAHAAHDARALAATIMRPDRVKMARAFAALFDAEVAACEGVLAAPSLRVRWGDEWAWLQWREAEAPWASECERGDGRVSVRAQMRVDEAFELMASRGLVPVEWVGTSEREYLSATPPVLPRPLPVGWRAQYITDEQRAQKVLIADDDPSGEPRTLRDVLTLASDAEGVSTAETLAREVVTRLAPWGVATAGLRVAWRVVDAGRWKTLRQSWWSEPLRSVMAEALGRASIALPAGMGPAESSIAPSWWTLAAIESTLALAWDAFARDGVTLIDAGGVRSFAEMKSPYDPLLALWSTGYVLDALTDARVVLVAPQL